LLPSLSGAWGFALTIGWITSQIAWAIHYWPTNPVKTALLLGIVVYILTNLAVKHLQSRIGQKDLLEYGLFLATSLLLLLITP
jgi:hypothetical protein